MSSFSTGQVAFCTATFFAVATGGSIVAATVTASKVATIVYTALAIVSGGAGVASVTAWKKMCNAKSADDNGASTDHTTYFEHFQIEVATTVPAYLEAAAAKFIEAVSLAIVRGVTDAIYNKMTAKGLTRLVVNFSN